jgi:hypothetical protein
MGAAEEPVDCERMLRCITGHAERRMARQAGSSDPG